MRDAGSDLKRDTQRSTDRAGDAASDAVVRWWALGWLAIAAVGSTTRFFLPLFSHSLDEWKRNDRVCLLLAHLSLPLLPLLPLASQDRTGDAIKDTTVRSS